MHQDSGRSVITKVYDWAPNNEWRSKLDNLSSDEIQVWIFNPNETRFAASALTLILATDELSRAQRLMFDHHREEFIASRWFLRNVLGTVSGIHPAQVRFEYSVHGKPILHPEINKGNVQFSLSRSAGVTVVALSIDRRVGIDVERMQPVADLDRLTNFVLSDNERLQLKRVPMTDRIRCFLTFWTLKEAYLKANGLGLIDDMQGIGFRIEYNQYVILEQAPILHRENSKWQFELLRIGPDVVSAIAYEQE